MDNGLNWNYTKFWIISTVFLNSVGFDLRRFQEVEQVDLVRYYCAGYCRVEDAKGDNPGGRGVTRNQ